MIGQVVQEVTTGERSLGRIDRLIALLVAAILVQTLLTWVAGAPRSCCPSGLRRLREDFSPPRCGCPSRSSSGPAPATSWRARPRLESLAHIIRFGVPAIVVAVATWSRRRSRPSSSRRWPRSRCSPRRWCTCRARAGTSSVRATATSGSTPPTPGSRRRVGDHRGRADHGRARPAEGAAAPLPGRARRVRRRGALHARAADALVPWLEIGFFLPIATAVLWGGGSRGTATSPSRPPPPSPSTCSSCSTRSASSSRGSTRSSSPQHRWPASSGSRRFPRPGGHRGRARR